MAVESTQMARASHSDNKSLKIIQIMSMLFLPASLVSSVFGMGFFSTSPDDSGVVQMYVSSRWWLYFAVSIPLTVVVMSSMALPQFSSWFRGRPVVKEDEKGGSMG